MRENRYLKGYSLVEILVVLGVFSILMIIATQVIALTLRGSRKSESVIYVKQELDYAANIVGRQLQNAKKIIFNPTTICTSGFATESAGYVSQSGVRGDVACLDMAGKNFYVDGNDVRIASSSGDLVNYKYRLTSNKVNITSCKFKCTMSGNDASILFEVTANARGVTGIEGSTFTTSREFLVRGSSRY